MYEDQPRVKQLPPHQRRVVDERTQLDVLRMRLAGFFGTPTFAALDEAEQGRLYRQAKAMAEYSAILGERIGAFK